MRNDSVLFTERWTQRGRAALSEAFQHCSKQQRRMAAWIGGRMRRGFAISLSLSYLFYGRAPRTFQREQRAMRAGFRRYSGRRDLATGSVASLRRNIHRLEKGLTMRPRRDIFATEFIADTVGCYLDVVEAHGDQRIESGGELQWARDVLAEYFQVVGSHATIDAARQQFKEVRLRSAAGEKRMVPYIRDLKEPPPVEIDALYTLAERRRSVRWFLNKHVSRTMIDRAIELAAQSPSACNRQPFVFRVLDDMELARAASAIPMGTIGYAENIPVFVVVVGQQRHYFHERDRHLIYIDGSLATMGFVYALESQGLSSCCINWPDIEDREARMVELLGLEPDERPIMCVAVGYPDPEGLVAYSQKKPLDQLRRYNFE